MKIVSWQLVIAILLALQLGNGNATTSRMALEAFDTSELRVTYVRYSGTPCAQYAVIVDPNGYRHVAIIGGYVGKKSGVVKKITAKNVVLEEVVQVDGEWELRLRMLPVEKEEFAPKKR